MSAIDTRNALMQLAEVFATQRKELLNTINRMNAGISALVAEGDKLLIPVMDEKEAGVKPTVTDGSISATTKATAAVIADVTNPRTRKCSNCGEPGHDARTCMNERVEKPEEPKVEKPKRQVSPERKAQLVETLKKARAAKEQRK